MFAEKINEPLSIRNGHLFVEDCDCVELTRRFGTPLFVVSENHLRANFRHYQSAFKKHWPEGRVRIMPAIKANPIIAVRRILTEEGGGCDVFGPGELEGALRGGVAGEDISVNGSIKNREVIRRAIDVGARVVLDSPRELELCEEEAASLGKIARVMFRIKPHMKELETESDFAPGFKICYLTQVIKYGIPTSEVLPMGPRAMELPHVEPVGIHIHMGRHSKKLEVWESWVRNCVYLTKEISDLMGGWVPQEMDFGGGFPSASDHDPDVVVKGYPGPSLDEYAQTITSALRDTMKECGLDASGILIEVEPGRGLHCDTGIHLTSVHNVKEETATLPRKWAEVDTSEVFLGVQGVSEEPYFNYVVANKMDQESTHKLDIVGLTCNAEMLVIDASLPETERGDVIALLDTGSYIEPMAANFNALPRPGTVLVSGAQADLIKRPETVDDVFARDIIPARLAG